MARKSWKENLYKGDESFHDLTFSGHHKCNRKELYSLQVSLNDPKTTSQIYFEKLFQNKEIKWKCIYHRPCIATTDANLHIFQYKIVYNVLYLN